MNALAEILSHPFCNKLGWTLLHLLWQGAAVAVLLAIVLRLLRKSSANLRYAAACSALALVVIFPVVTIRLVPAPASHSFLEAGSASLPPATGEAMKIVPVTLESVGAAAPVIGLKERAVNLLEPALPYVVACWVLGVFALSLYHLGGWTHLQRLRRRLTKQADDTLLAKLSVLGEKLRIKRPVRLVESALVQIPTVVGWMRPVILLPATAVTGLTGEQIEALFAHELAHIRRGDYFINMLQTVVEILGFYHPAVWWISNKIRVERENCCDDVAVAICGDKMHYATALAEMERIRSTQGELAIAANGGDLLMRIRRLIGKSTTPKSRFNWAGALMTALVIAALAIPTTLALSGSRAGKDTAAATGERTGETDEAQPPAPEVAASEAEYETQILFDFRIFEIPSDSKLLKGIAKENETFFHTDKAFVEELLELGRKGKEVKVLAAPKVLTFAGKEALIETSKETPYISGYAEQDDGESKPIIKYVDEGFKIKLKGELVGDNVLKVDLAFSQTAITSKTKKAVKGGEIQIPIINSVECATVATIANNDSVIIGGLQSADKSGGTLVVLAVARIIGKGETDSAAIADSSEETSLAAGPQVISSVRVDTGGASEKAAGRFYELRHAKAVKIADALRPLASDPECKIMSDVTSNRLLVVASKSQHEEIESLIAQLDVASPGEAEKAGTDIRVFQLRYGGASSVTDALKSLLPKEQEGVKIMIDPHRSTRLIVQGNKDGIERVGRLIELLDGPQAGTPVVDTVTQVVQLKYADSQQVGKILVELGGLGRDTRIVSDARLNQLIIEAPEANLKRIEHLIEQIDRPVDEKAAKKQNSAKDEQVAVLINEREVLAEKMRALREVISQQQRKSGISEFAKQQDLMLQRAVNLMNELAKTESLRAQLEAQLSLLEQGKEPSLSPQERIKMRQEHVNSDATVKALAERIAQVEMDLVLARQSKGDDHPEVTSQVNLLKALSNRLAEAKAEVGEVFDKLMAVQADEARVQRMDKAKAEIEQNMAYEQKLRARLDREKAETDAIAQSQLQIQSLRDELESIKAMYDEVNRRITDIRMEPQMPALYDISEPAQK